MTTISIETWQTFVDNKQVENKVILAICLQAAAATAEEQLNPIKQAWLDANDVYEWERMNKLKSKRFENYVPQPIKTLKDAWKMDKDDYLNYSKHWLSHLWNNPDFITLRNIVEVKGYGPEETYCPILILEDWYRKLMRQLREQISNDVMGVAAPTMLDDIDKLDKLIVSAVMNINHLTSSRRYVIDNAKQVFYSYRVDCMELPAMIETFDRELGID